MKTFQVVENFSKFGKRYEYFDIGENCDIAFSEIIANVDSQLKASLSKKELRNLMFLIKKHYSLTRSDINKLKNPNEHKYIRHIEIEKHEEILLISYFYDKANISDEDRKYHWDYYWIKRYKEKNDINYKKMEKPPHQDNKNVLVGSGGSNANKIRFPRKCRKTAWKRFYKLFPKLKPE